MAVKFGSNIDYTGAYPNFERDVVNTMAELQSQEVKENYGEGCLVYCKEDGNVYSFNGSEFEVIGGGDSSFMFGAGTNSSLQVNAYNCEASGTNSIATGVKCIASGNYSVAMGRHNEASGRGSVALGGITKGFTFTGAAGTTRYSTNITDTYAKVLYVGQRCHLSTEGNDEVYYTIQSWEIVDNVYYVTLDRTIDANNDASTTLYLLANAAVGTSSIALGGVVKGTNSAALGQWNLVNGGASVALGGNNLNSGSYSFSAGYNNTVDGSAALALGHTNKAVGGQAIAIGFGNEATEPVAIAIGNKNTVPKQSAIAIGGLNDSIGSCSTAIGYRNKAHHHGTVTLGGYTTATNQGEVAVGIGNISHSGTRFSVGGANELMYYDETTNKNLLEIMSNGDIWIGNYNEGKKLWDATTETSPLIEEIVNSILSQHGLLPETPSQSPGTPEISIPSSITRVTDTNKVKSIGVDPEIVQENITFARSQDSDGYSWYPESVSLSKTNDLRLIASYEHVNKSVDVTYTNFDKGITITSQNTDILTVSEPSNGVCTLTAISEGQATVIVKNGDDLVGSYSVDVKNSSLNTSGVYNGNASYACYYAGPTGTSPAYWEHEAAGGVSVTAEGDEVKISPSVYYGSEIKLGIYYIEITAGGKTCKYPGYPTLLTLEEKR